MTPLFKKLPLSHPVAAPQPQAICLQTSDGFDPRPSYFEPRCLDLIKSKQQAGAAV
jgi:hypothetical protein